MPPNAAIKPMPAAAALLDSNLLGNRQNGAIELKQAALAITKAAMIGTGEGSASTTRWKPRTPPVQRDMPGFYA